MQINKIKLKPNLKNFLLIIYLKITVIIFIKAGLQLIWFFTQKMMLSLILILKPINIVIKLIPTVLHFYLIALAYIYFYNFN